MEFEVLKPRLILFLSVDLTGSTQLKIGKPTHSSGGIRRDVLEAWVQIFRTFYQQFPETFRLSYENITEDIPETLPNLWKLQGDEILFWVELKREVDARTHLNAFTSALKQYHDDIKAQRISVKGTAWLAGFPVNNLIIDRQDGVDCDASSEAKARCTLVDFIGPYVDIGFRLTKFATPRRLVVSVDLAWLLTKHRVGGNFSFQYLSRQELRGLPSGGYPVFWIRAVEDEFDKTESELIEEKPLNEDQVHVACTAFIEKTEYLKPPFVYGDSQVPKDYEKNLESVRQAVGADRSRTEPVPSDPKIENGEYPESFPDIFQNT